MATWRNAGARNRPIGVPLPSLVPEFLRGYASAQLQHHDPGGWEARNSLNHSTGRTLLYEARQGEVPTAQLQAQEQRLQCPDAVDEVTNLQILLGSAPHSGPFGVPQVQRLPNVPVMPLAHLPTLTALSAKLEALHWRLQFSLDALASLSCLSSLASLQHLAPLLLSLDTSQSQHAQPRHLQPSEHVQGGGAALSAWELQELAKLVSQLLVKQQEHHPHHHHQGQHHQHHTGQHPAPQLPTLYSRQHTHPSPSAPPLPHMGSPARPAVRGSWARASSGSSQEGPAYGPPRTSPLSPPSAPPWPRFSLDSSSSLPPALLQLSDQPQASASQAAKTDTRQEAQVTGSPPPLEQQAPGRLEGGSLQLGESAGSDQPMPVQLGSTASSASSSAGVGGRPGKGRKQLPLPPLLQGRQSLLTGASCAWAGSSEVGSTSTPGTSANISKAELRPASSRASTPMLQGSLLGSRQAGGYTGLSSSVPRMPPSRAARSLPEGAEGANQDGLTGGSSAVGFLHAPPAAQQQGAALKPTTGPASLERSNSMLSVAASDMVMFGTVTREDAESFPVLDPALLQTPVHNMGNGVEAHVGGNTGWEQAVLQTAADRVNAATQQTETISDRGYSAHSSMVLLGTVSTLGSTDAAVFAQATGLLASDTS